MVETEMSEQMLYNQYMMQITNQEVRQLFTQLRDEHMQNITQLQQHIQQLMQNTEVK
jgi:rubrerythrin